MVVNKDNTHDSFLSRLQNIMGRKYRSKLAPSAYAHVVNTWPKFQTCAHIVSNLASFIFKFIASLIPSQTQRTVNSCSKESIKATMSTAYTKQRSTSRRHKSFVARVLISLRKRRKKIMEISIGGMTKVDATTTNQRQRRCPPVRQVKRRPKNEATLFELTPKSTLRHHDDGNSKGDLPSPLMPSLSSKTTIVQELKDQIQVLEVDNKNLRDALHVKEFELSMTLKENIELQNELVSLRRNQDRLPPYDVLSEIPLATPCGYNRRDLHLGCGVPEGSSVVRNSHRQPAPFAVAIPTTYRDLHDQRHGHSLEGIYCRPDDYKAGFGAILSDNIDSYGKEEHHRPVPVPMRLQIEEEEEAPQLIFLNDEHSLARVSPAEAQGSHYHNTETRTSTILEEATVVQVLEEVDEDERKVAVDNVNSSKRHGDDHIT